MVVGASNPTDVDRTDDVPAGRDNGRRVAALDIGGTKIAAASVAAFRSDPPVTGAGLGTVRSVPTPAEGDADHVWAAVCSVLDPVMDDGPEAIGVGVGGPMEPGGVTVSTLNIAAWREFPLRARLVDRYGLDVRIDNDAKALAVAEGRWGAARGHSNYLAMVVSTGVGGGVVSDGRLLDGERGNAGHIGHITVEPDGALCACGARGCLEAEASGSGIARITGRPAAEASVEIRRRAGMLVGRAVASVATLLDLRLAVVAGSVALGYGDEFFAAAQAELTSRARLEFAHGAQIVPAGLGASGPILGAAALGAIAAQPPPSGGK